MDEYAWGIGMEEEEAERERLRILVRNWPEVRSFADTLE